MEGFRRNNPQVISTKTRVAPLNQSVAIQTEAVVTWLLPVTAREVRWQRAQMRTATGEQVRDAATIIVAPYNVIG